MSHDTTTIRCMKYIPFFKDIYISLQQPRDDSVYYTETICIFIIFLYHDTYLDDCITINRDTRCIVAPLGNM